VRLFPCAFLREPLARQKGEPRIIDARLSRGRTRRRKEREFSDGCGGRAGVANVKSISPLKFS
jgi:hypothetical protein